MAETIRDRAGRLLPTGDCWCGCGAETSTGNFFVPGHDKFAEAAVIKLRYGSVAEFLVEHGFGPASSSCRAEMERWHAAGGRTR